MLLAMDLRFDQTDFSVVVKKRAPAPKQWRWEIYRAGRNSPVEYSSALYETMTAANRAGKRPPQGDGTLIGNCASVHVDRLTGDESARGRRQEHRGAA